MSKKIAQSLMKLPGEHRLYTTLAARIFLFAMLFIYALNQAWAADAMHMGVASCASGTCHGSAAVFTNSNIQRNEFRVWNEQDPHARAYKTLLTPQSHGIAEKLGLASASNAEICLTCHADNVPLDLRADDFDVGDGVGCETCHGGAQHYLESHTTQNHTANLKAGLTALEAPVTRARLCVSCHIGDNRDRQINHTIMGAGHPRLSFELNTFSAIQPAHYRIDADYVARKGGQSELQYWAVGQVVAAERILDNIQAMPRSGLFPEFVHMDCLGCHQAMSKITWTGNPLTRLGPGVLRYNDAHLMMAYQLALAVAPQLAGQLLESIRGFLEIGDSGQSPESKMATLREILAKLMEQLHREPIANLQGLNILRALLEVGLTSSHRDFASAEQSAMAINSVLKAIDSNQFPGKRSDALSGMEGVFSSLDKAERYRPEAFIKGLRKIQSALASIE